ncbi:MAG: hypothetical protein C5B49_07565 [Bdellovibrio sp.]|nr:MAG: hypothetical protein C5B49_07565 [Bdellovibrio sp.]
MFSPWALLISVWGFGAGAPAITSAPNPAIQAALAPPNSPAAVSAGDLNSSARAEIQPFKMECASSVSELKAKTRLLESTQGILNISDFRANQIYRFAGPGHRRIIDESCMTPDLSLDIFSDHPNVLFANCKSRKVNDPIADFSFKTDSSGNFWSQEEHPRWAKSQLCSNGQKIVLQFDVSHGAYVFHIHTDLSKNKAGGISAVTFGHRVTFQGRRRIAAEGDLKITEFPALRSVDQNPAVPTADLANSKDQKSAESSPVGQR